MISTVVGVLNLQNVSNVVEKKHFQSNYFYPFFSVKLNEVNNKSLHQPGKPVKHRLDLF